MNNLLTIILGNGRIALSDLAPDAALRRRLSRILSAAEHAAALVDQLFAYSGTAAPALRPLDLSKLVAAMLDLIRASVSDGCVFEVDLAENLPAVDGNATQVRQVILNLVTNGSQALSDRKGRVSLCTSVMKADASYLTDTFGVADPAAGEFVYLEVSDTGRGFDASTQQRIFEPLFTTKLSGRGLGWRAGDRSQPPGGHQGRERTGRGELVSRSLPDLARVLRRTGDPSRTGGRVTASSWRWTNDKGTLGVSSCSSSVRASMSEGPKGPGHGRAFAAGVDWRIIRGDGIGRSRTDPVEDGSPEGDREDEGIPHQREEVHAEGRGE